MRCSAAGVLIATTSALGCAPLASLRPAGGLWESGRSIEIGAGVAALGPRPYVVETWQPVGQLWGTFGLGRSFELSAVGAFDDRAFAAGTALRWIPLRATRLAWGAEVEFGFAWAALALPVAARLSDGFWLYSAPRLGNLGIHLTPGLPAGLSLELFDGWAVRAEAQLSWQEFLAYQRRVHLAAGIAYQW